MQSIEKINKVMKIKISDKNCDIEESVEIQSQTKEKRSNLMNLNTKYNYSYMS